MCVEGLVCGNKKNKVITLKDDVKRISDLTEALVTCTLMRGLTCTGAEGFCRWMHVCLAFPLKGHH